jgi:hypothetical protein
MLNLGSATANSVYYCPRQFPRPRGAAAGPAVSSARRTSRPVTPSSRCARPPTAHRDARRRAAHRPTGTMPIRCASWARAATAIIQRSRRARGSRAFDASVRRGPTDRPRDSMPGSLWMSTRTSIGSRRRPRSRPHCSTPLAVCNESRSSPRTPKMRACRRPCTGFAAADVATLPARPPAHTGTPAPTNLSLRARSPRAAARA